MKHSDDALASALAQTFGGRVRVRVCGICLEGDAVLLAAHAGMGGPLLWMPPGGGLDFQEPASDALRREFLEETGLEVEVERFLFLYEVISGPFHAIELFFEVRAIAGQLAQGTDPELEGQAQSLSGLRFVPFAELQAWPPNHKHGLFQYAPHADALLGMQGLYRYHRSTHTELP